MIVAILLLPVCVGAGRTLWMVMRACGTADTTLVPILAGVACLVGLIMAAASQEDKSLVLLSAAWLLIMLLLLTGVLWLALCR